MKKTLLIIIIVIVIAGAGYFLTNRTSEIVVTNFEECLAAGNPVMESYPRQCRHEGVTYTEKIDKSTNDFPTSADDAPSGSIHNLPVPDAVARVREKIADDLGIREGLVIIMSAYEKVWTNGCLDLQEPEEICNEAMVEGYEVTAQAEGREFIYHTNEDGSLLRQKK